tara:strand:- start:172 stop:363 length:192 start_codon:yes stop_codon:yes gene_type:complete
MGNYVQNKAINEIIKSSIKLNRHDVIRKINDLFSKKLNTKEFFDKRLNEVDVLLDKKAYQSVK